MKNCCSNFFLIISFFCFVILSGVEESIGQNISINTTGAANSTLSMLEILQISTTASSKGLHISNSGIITGTGYGIWSEVTGASTTNIAGYFSATGGTNNYALIVPASSGIVGIGTVAPTANYLTTFLTNGTIENGIKMSLVGGGGGNFGINISSTSASYKGIFATNSSNAGTTYYEVGGDLTGGTAATGYLGYHTSGLNNFAVYGTGGNWAGYFEKGKVAITALNPPTGTADLDVQNTTAGAGIPASIALRQSTQSPNINDILANLDFGASDLTTGQARIQTIRGAASGGAGDLPTDMLFYTTPDASATLTERMRITNAGNVGIGTTAPLYKLHSTTTVAGSRAIYGENTDATALSGYGVWGHSMNAAGYGIGGYFEGGFRGVYALGDVGISTINAFGVLGEATGSTGSSTGSKTGVYGKSYATTPGLNYGLYGDALNSTVGNYGLWVQNGETKITDGNGAVPVRTANGSIATSVNGSNRIWYRTNNTNYFVNNSGVGDYSEFFKTSDTTLAIGEIVSLSSVNDNGVQRANSKEQMLLGVVSKYGTRNNDDQEGQRMYDKKSVNIALLGQLLVKVSDENGNISPGDPLTLSEKHPGVAVKAITDGKIIGYAMTHYPYVDGEEHYPTHTDAKGEKDCLKEPHVMALIQQSYWSSQNSQQKILDSQKMEIEKLKAENNLFKTDIEKIKLHLGIDAKSEK
ncbi:MAG: hypothetical protein HY063_10210 [Bacteroidetes bacterium]|nr:hypothetical protein [Bacteroidota bacterium]